MNKNIYKATTDQTSGEQIKNKFLDYEGVKHLWSKINMNDYPNNQTLIDVINAIDETKADKSEIVPADWNAAEGEPGHVLNRPFYSGVTESVVLPECNIEYDEDGSVINTSEIPLFNLIPGNEYTVNWNGVHYKCTAAAMNIDGITVAFVGDIGFVETGTPATGEPFVIGTMSGQMELVPLDGSTSVTLSITTEQGEVVHKLDNKYLNLSWLPIIEKGVVLLEKTVVESNKSAVVEFTEFTHAVTLGQVVHVEYDSVRYECTIAEVEGHAVIGNQSFISGNLQNSGEPFILVVQSDTRLFCVFADGGSHEIAIYDFAQDGEIYNQIPAGFLSDEMLKAYDISTEVQKELTNKANIRNPVFNGHFSVNRKSDSTIGASSVAVGYMCEASGYISFAEGDNTTASGTISHAEGDNTVASGAISHAEGQRTVASGAISHAEGQGTVASGVHSHAEGFRTVASGSWSHAEGQGTVASGNCSHAQGRFNIEDAEKKYAHIVGNGYRNDSADSGGVRSNAHTLDWSGNAWYAGDVYVGSTSGTNRDEGSVKLAKISDIPKELTAEDAIALAIETGLINPIATTSDNTILTDVNNNVITL